MLHNRILAYMLASIMTIIIASSVTAAINGLTINNNASISPGKTMLNVSGTVTCSDLDFAQIKGGIGLSL